MFISNNTCLMFECICIRDNKYSTLIITLYLLFFTFLMGRGGGNSGWFCPPPLISEWGRGLAKHVNLQFWVGCAAVCTCTNIITINQPNINTEQGTGCPVNLVYKKLSSGEFEQVI